MKKEVAADLFFLAVALVIFAVLVGGQVPAPKPVVEAKCHDTGSFSVSNLEDRAKSVAVKKSGGSSSAVSGSWREMSTGLYKFTSDDMAVVDVKGGYYTAVVDKKSYGMTCPAFEFSCKLINITVNSCYKRNDSFVAKYTAYSYRYDKKNEFRFEKPFMLGYEAVANVDGRKKELEHSPIAVSPEFKTINISRIKMVGSNTYTLRWTTPLNITKFVVRYDDCETAKYAFYDSFECTDRPFCARDGDCLQSERCDDNRCIPISCAACQYVANHTCADYDCCTDNDCDEGFVCGTGSRCEPLSCGFNEYVSGHGCEPLECGEDEYVFNGSCSKLNCAQDELAMNHACKKIECQDSEVARDGVCQKLKCGFLKKAKNHGCVSFFSFKAGRNT